MKNIMKGFGWMIGYGVSVASAAPAGEGESMSLLGYLFLGFFMLIIVSQLVPACILFFGMVKGVFSAGKKADAASSE